MNLFDWPTLDGLIEALVHMIQVTLQDSTVMGRVMLGLFIWTLAIIIPALTTNMDDKHRDADGPILREHERNEPTRTP